MTKAVQFRLLPDTGKKTWFVNDEQLRNLDERLTYLRNLEERKETVLASIEEQGKLTEELKQQILAAQTQVLLEDLYRPYRPKRRTRATIAKEKGLEGLANQILLQMLDHSVEEEAKQYLDEEKEVTTVEQAISGALDILAEAIADEADYRTAIRKTTMQKGSLVSTAKMQKRKRFTKIIMIFLRCFPRCPDIRLSQLTAVRKKNSDRKIEAPEDDILRYLRKK